VELRPLNQRRWLLAVLLTGVGLLLGWPLDLRIGWVLVLLGQALLVIEAVRRLGLWPSRGSK
jgi:hypothetical protein